MAYTADAIDLTTKNALAFTLSLPKSVDKASECRYTDDESMCIMPINEFSDYPTISFAELLPIVQALPQPEKWQLMEILQHDVLEDISPLEHHKTYWIWTR
ncbi:MAG TPA: hypothetical protein ENG03_06590 [Thioploca sp.]|nr:MAG: hypothetical protein B6247_24345 [Beggiatoa sp. 4572_84]RKZ46398.1 MAG: hypothetical protein DRR08_33365 [Gammaproteobacteria bacterium]HDN26753.1 hypothetical protein [Thioploca sp.]